MPVSGPKVREASIPNSGHVRWKRKCCSWDKVGLQSRLQMERNTEDMEKLGN